MLEMEVHYMQSSFEKGLLTYNNMIISVGAGKFQGSQYSQY